MSEPSRALWADPRLSRYDPLPRVIIYDDFDEGIHGWSELIGNYEDTLDAMLPGFADLRPPMLSNAAMWDTGSAGSMEGTYALKLATRARRGHIAASLKPDHLACARADSLGGLFHLQARSVGLPSLRPMCAPWACCFDLQDAEYRWMPHLRYLNAQDGQQLASGNSSASASRCNRSAAREKTRSHFHLPPPAGKMCPTAGRSSVITRSPPSETGTICGWISI
jgi:hypothetical protein